LDISRTSVSLIYEIKDSGLRLYVYNTTFYNIKAI